MLYPPPPPRKQPDVRRCLGAPHGTGIRKTVSNEGAQGSRETVNRSHAQSASAVWARWDQESARNSCHQDCFLFPQDRCLSCCSPPISSPASRLSHNLQNRTWAPRGPSRSLLSEWPLSCLAFRAESKQRITGQLCFRKSEWNSAHHRLWCSLRFIFF